MLSCFQPVNSSINMTAGTYIILLKKTSFDFTTELCAPYLEPTFEFFYGHVIQCRLYRVILLIFSLIQLIAKKFWQFIRFVLFLLYFINLLPPGNLVATFPLEICHPGHLRLLHLPPGTYIRFIEINLFFRRPINFLSLSAKFNKVRKRLI